ncbi:MAG: hypothetical protein ABGY75_15665 [Gemmataceae bacterium]
MYLFCPKCHTKHPATGRCPRCSSRLLVPAEAAEILPRSVIDAPSSAIHTSFSGRLTVGVVIALGLHLALSEWVTGAAELSGSAIPPGAAVWVHFALRLVAAAAGGLLAGAGRHVGFGGGLLVGLAGGLAWLTVDCYPRVEVNLLRAGLVGVMAAASGVAAWVGERVWPGAKELPVPESARNSSLIRLKPGEGKKQQVRPTRWLQVIIGATAAVIGVLAADWVRTGMMMMPKGLFNMGGPGAAARIDAQIAAFLVMLSGFTAGAGTGTGLRHGLFAGLLAAAGVVGLNTALPDGSFPPIEFLVDKLGVVEPPETAAAVGATVLAVVAVGGWLGGQLFPKLSRRKKLASM